MIEKIKTRALKNPILRNLRDSLRTIIYKSVFTKIRILGDIEESLLKECNYKYEELGEEKLKTVRECHSKAGDLNRSLRKSICMCSTCGRIGTDMVYYPHMTDYKVGYWYGAWFCPIDFDYYSNRNTFKKFTINEFLSVVFKESDTWIYVKGKQFRSCRILILEIPKNETREYDQITSIDEIEKFFKTFDFRKSPDSEYIPLLTQFWAHCSNLQAWYEHNYDTRLLHSNIAFPLLRELTVVGDSTAKKVFKEEIVSRYSNGTDNVRLYLKKEGYLDILTDDELKSLNID